MPHRLPDLVPHALQIWMLLGVLVVGLSGCNEPPLYESRARDFLEKQGVANPTIERLLRRRPLSAAEIHQLAAFRKVIPVLHLLGANPATPETMLRQLAEHPSFEVRTGIAGNPHAPVDLLLGLRVRGSYHTVNHYLSRNPSVPANVLIEMFRSGEATELGFAMNPRCPPELMTRIAASEHELTRYWLARNPGLTESVRLTLQQDPSERVRTAAAGKSGTRS